MYCRTNLNKLKQLKYVDTQTTDTQAVLLPPALFLRVTDRADETPRWRIEPALPRDFPNRQSSFRSAAQRRGPSTNMLTTRVCTRAKRHTEATLMFWDGDEAECSVLWLHRDSVFWFVRYHFPSSPSLFIHFPFPLSSDRKVTQLSLQNCAYSWQTSTLYSIYSNVLTKQNPKQIRHNLKIYDLSLLLKTN